MRSLTAAAFATVALLCGAAPASADFVDGFDGTAIDGTKWDTSHATSGERWCADGATAIDAANSHYFLNDGDWIDPSQPCWGQTETAPGPFGKVDVDGGVASLTTGRGLEPGDKSKTFPFLYTASNPFPAGDFTFEVRLKFTPQWGHGTWFAASDWTPTFGPNESYGPGNVLAIIGSMQKTYVQFLDHEWPVTLHQPHAPVRQYLIPDPYGWHTYTLDYVDGKYTFSFDGNPIFADVASSKRPSRLFMGNPVFTHWGESWWNPLAVDFVTVNGTAGADADGDGAPDDTDNCVSTPNASQTDTDGDGIGNACEPDGDGDGVIDDADNCVSVANGGQADADSDGVGDACEPDGDGDGVIDDADNCDAVANAGQANADGDAYGDACEPDGDADGTIDDHDNCAYVANGDQANADGDAYGDACEPDGDADGVIDDTDNCVSVPNGNQANADGDTYGDACEPDGDGDGTIDDADNCAGLGNDQADADGDGIGDACEPDSDGDTVIDDTDNCLAAPNPGQEDTDADGAGDACDALPYGTPEEQLEDVLVLVLDLNAGGGVENKIRNALSAIDSGNLDRACSQIESAASQLLDKRGKPGYPPAEVDEILAALSRIHADVPC